MAARSAARLIPGAAGIVALAAGLWTSLARLGFEVEGVQSLNHGPLMVGGFIGTIIALERAVALGRPWGYAGPALGAVAAVMLLFSAPYQAAAVPLFLSSLVLLATFAVFIKRGAADFTVIMAVGALAWTVGNGLLLSGWLIPHVVPWWAGFLILTIAGERIEMSRVRPRPPWARRFTHTLVGLYAAALFLTLVDHDLGVRAGGVTLIALCLALAHGDVARWTRRSQGVARYAAYSILSGYAWLALSGLLAAVFGQPLGGLHYDAWTHSVFVGFVMVMIMAHAPIILPAVAGIAVAFSRWMYVPVILLQASLVLRIAADLMLWWSGRQWTGLLNVVAVVLFLAVMVRGALRARRAAGAEAQPQPTGSPATLVPVKE